MHRFRKRSDAGHSQAASIAAAPLRFPPAQPPPLAQSLPSLPPESDFRTSLILPDLTKRFTLLRSASGTPVPLDDIRNRLAEKRAQALDTAISEEEEDMLVEALSRIRLQNSKTNRNADEADSRLRSQPSYSASESSQSSVRQSSNTMSSGNNGYGNTNIESSPGSRSSKRHSNNLFGSGQFRDFRYMRRATNKSSVRSINSVASSVTSRSGTTAGAESFQTLDESLQSTSLSSDQRITAGYLSDRYPITQTTSSSSDVDDVHPVNEMLLTKPLGRAQLQRLSTSLEEVIREMEEEAEDQVLIPRSPHPNNSHKNTPSIEPEKLNITIQPSAVISQDSPIDRSPSTEWIAVEHPGPDSVSPELVSPYPRSGTASPVPRVPGYIPGMPRPMTPRERETRDSDTDDLRSYSTTPKAAAPVYEKAATPMPIHAGYSHASGIHAIDMMRYDSNASTARAVSPRSVSPRSASPSVLGSPFSSRAGNVSGRYTPEERHRTLDSISSVSSSVNDLMQASDSTLTSKRRPSSPLSNNVYQPIMSNSRPSTPSNVTWNVRPKSPGIQQTRSQDQAIKASSHVRDGSNFTMGDYEASGGFALDRSKSITRSLRSPPLPDSPTIDGDAPSNDFSIDSQLSGTTVFDSSSNIVGYSSIPKLELGTPILLQSPMQADVYSPIPILGSPLSPLIPTSPQSPGKDIDRSFSTPVRNTPQRQHFPSQSTTQTFSFSPTSNSSRSSIVSTGSSYHSWNEEHPNEGLGIGILGDLDDEKEPAWHDFSEEEVMAARGNVVQDPEAILSHFTGLTRYDLARIQMRLFEATQNRGTKSTESRTSTLRRRRPSTAQSVHSLGGRESRTTSPAPQSPVAASFSNTMDHTAKANALLNSVVDSIIDPIVDAQQPEVAPEAIAPIVEQNDDDVIIAPVPTADSSPARRNKDLAAVLFGTASKEEPILSNNLADPIIDDNLSSNDQADTTSTNDHGVLIESTPSEAHSFSPVVEPASSKSSLRSVPVDHSQLARIIQERTDAAMAQLGKKDSIKYPHSPSARKKVSPQDISSPRLVQSSAPFGSFVSVPTGYSPSVSPESRQSTSRISSRMRKLRNTLRVKPQPTSGDELSPWMRDTSTPDVSGSHKKIASSPSPINSGSTADLRARRSEVSTPQSANTSLKFGFMSRFRKRPQGDSPSDIEKKINDTYIRRPTTAPDTPPFSAPPFTQTQRIDRDRMVVSPDNRIVDYRMGNQTPSLSRSGTIESRSPRTPNENALKQFFDAGENLGLDPAILNEFVANQSSNPRSTASAVKAANLVRQASLNESKRGPSREGLNSLMSSPPDRRRTRTPEPSKNPLLVVSNEGEGDRSFSGTPDSQNANAIVRRTLILPSENGSNSDLTSLLKKVAKKGQRISNNSLLSGRSIHDRVPTPPPPRVKRFSKDSSPPVPRLPSSVSHREHGEMLSPSPLSPSPAGRSNYAYDSVYDMYSDTNADRQYMSDIDETTVEPNSETADGGKVLELIEMANGETIWSIVNGLRDEDFDSISPQRISVNSEFSVLPSEGEEQLFFKEHARSNSKGSSISFLSRKRNIPTANRPETKVFYSSTTQIARLIEELSRNADAGSFNIKPKSSVHHSHSSSLQSESDANWTVEERLERMLGSMQT